MPNRQANTFLKGSMGRTYAKIAFPIILVMAMNGMLSISDALFLGHYVGPEALAAVTLMFPIYMLIVALATLVTSGMSSLLARQLGGNRLDEARATFAGAHGLGLLLAGFVIALFAQCGWQVSTIAAAGSEELAEMGYIYLQITVLMSPLLIFLAINSDALRSEGRVVFMAVVSFLASFANIGFNYVLIAHLHLEVAGSALGTALAQTLALAIIAVFRFRGATALPIASLRQHSLLRSWKQMLALGAPQSLSFIGFSLGSAMIIAALQMVEAANYDNTVAAYGIITRVLTFAYMPLLGLSHAMQTITGNNYGAALWARSNGSLRFALIASFFYCCMVQAVVVLFPAEIGKAFVADTVTISEIARILPIMSLFFWISGPLMMIAMHFQAIGDARRAGLLGLAKPYLFAIPFTLGLALAFGEVGIWLAGPAADISLLVLTGIVLAGLAKKTTLRWGLFETSIDRTT